MIFYILMISVIFSQLPEGYDLDRNTRLNRFENISYNKLNSNSIFDIRQIDESYLLISTGSGLSYINIYDDNPDSINFGSFNKNLVPLPRGGAPALVVKDNIIAISGIVDTQAVTGLELMGTGISYSMDYGENWDYISQPIDSIPSSGNYHTVQWGGQDIRVLSVTTEINNISYDLSIGENYIYAASWAGGIRRYGPLDAVQKNWQIIPLPMDSDTNLIGGSILDEDYELNPNDPDNGGNHNHKGFSVLVLNDTIWAGTAYGINKGIIESDCITWTKHYTSEYYNGNLSGNWVIGFFNQKFNELKERIWAITWSGGNGNERHALSYTDDGGSNWETTYPSGYSEKVYNLYSYQNKIWAASESGLYTSLDGDHWEKYSDKKIDSITGEQIFAESVLAVFFENEWLWLGTSDGLGIITNNNRFMTVHRYWEPANQLSVYPNPFLMDEYNQSNGVGHVRFIFTNSSNHSGMIDIFDFTMDKVIQLNSYSMVNESESEIIWNGKNEYGNRVANGIYFCRLSLNNNYYWTKLAIVKSK